MCIFASMISANNAYVFLCWFFILFIPQTFRVIKCFLEKLERLSENPDLLEEMGWYYKQFLLLLEYLVEFFSLAETVLGVCVCFKEGILFTYPYHSFMMATMA